MLLAGEKYIYHGMYLGLEKLLLSSNIISFDNESLICISSEAKLTFIIPYSKMDTDLKYFGSFADPTSHAGDMLAELDRLAIKEGQQAEPLKSDTEYVYIDRDNARHCLAEDKFGASQPWEGISAYKPMPLCRRRLPQY